MKFFVLINFNYHTVIYLCKNLFPKKTILCALCMIKTQEVTRNLIWRIDHFITSNSNKGMERHLTKSVFFCNLTIIEKWIWVFMIFIAENSVKCPCLVWQTTDWPTMDIMFGYFKIYLNWQISTFKITLYDI